MQAVADGRSLDALADALRSIVNLPARLATGLASSDRTLQGAAVAESLVVVSGATALAKRVVKTTPGNPVDAAPKIDNHSYRDGAEVKYDGPVDFQPGGVLGGKGGVSGTLAEGAAPGPVNLMGDKDLFFRNAANRADIDPNGALDVIAHGSSQNIEVLTARGPVTVDQRIASRLIESSSGYTPGQPVRLLSCDTGACDAGFAQNLANKMGVPVQGLRTRNA